MQANARAGIDWLTATRCGLTIPNRRKTARYRTGSIIVHLWQICHPRHAAAVTYPERLA